MCLPDGTHNLINTGFDLIGSKLEVNNGSLVINEEYLQSGEAKTFVVGQSPANPTPRSVPSMTPSVGYHPISPNLCYEHESKLFIEFMTDSKSEYDNKLFIESNYDLAWVEIIRMQNFRSSNLNAFTSCLKKSTCHRLKIIDAEANGLCCENGQGWCDVYWNGKHDFFVAS